MPERKSPPIVNAVVQVGVARMRISVGPSDASSYRPRMCLWVDAANGPILHFELGKERQPDVMLVMHSLEQLARRLGGLPRQIQLRNLEMARALRSALEPLGVEVVVRESLPMLDEAVDSMMRAPHLGGEPRPGLLDVPGMTADHVIAFAEAAGAFYSARPWQHLIDDDLIAIESPAGPKGTQFTQVLGAAGQTFGLGFVPSLEDHENLRATGELPRGGAWSLTLGDIDSIPFDDGEAWDRNNFPTAGPDAYPTFLKFGKSSGYRHPTPDELIWAEGLLRAMSQTTEDEMDRGRWEKSVQTYNGPATYRFSMPFLLEQMAGGVVTDPTRRIESGRRKLEAMMRTIGQQLGAKPPMNLEEANRFLQSFEGQPIPDASEPVTDADRAVALLDQALDSRGRRQVQLAREALKIDPDCVDALLLLAERQSDPEISLPMFRRAVEAGERSLGPDVFKNDVGHFWGILETRPYMRARQHVAMKLADLGRDEESAAELRELLRLNPGDNQGNRYLLIHRLFDIEGYDELETLLDNPEYSETSAEWSFARALLAFRRGGDTAESCQQLRAAMTANRFVVPLLIGNVGMPPMLPASFSRGSEEEAFIYVDEAAFEWEETDGAIEWLEEGLEQFKKQVRKKARESGKKKDTKKRK